MKRVGIVGVSGYSGFICLKLLLNHPEVRVMYVGANTTTGPVADIWPQLKGKTKLVCKKYNFVEASKLCDVVFLAVPHTTAMDIVPDLLTAGIQVIDLSADYRLKSRRDYKKWYGVAHKDPKNIRKAVYGLPELYREKIKKANFIANPGCYPTAALLGLAPITAIFSKDIQSVIIDAKSGTSGAGRKASVDLHYCEINENCMAYKVLKHQHQPEIELHLDQISDGRDFSFNFAAHLLPLNQGILETIYVQLKGSISINDIHKIYQRFYKTEPFVRVLQIGEQPELKNVANSNYCDIGLAVSGDGSLLAITAAIDNLYKGAAGQAVQNMNLMCGFKEYEGLLL